MAARSDKQSYNTRIERHLNTLYITSDSVWLQKDGTNIVVKRENKVVKRFVADRIQSILCMAYTNISSSLMAYCFEKNIGISFVTPHGQFQARVEGAQKGNVALRRAQHQATLCEKQALPVAKSFIAAKLKNQRSVILRTLRDHKNKKETSAIEALEQGQAKIQQLLKQMMQAESLESVRGFEGSGAKTYFSVFHHMILATEAGYQFKGRSKRPPKDLPNAILSFLYTILQHDCRTALECQGLDPQMGFLHQDRPGRASLACDLVEEFRAAIVDRVCLNLINRRQIGLNECVVTEDGGVILTDDSRKIVLAAYQERKQQKITHGFLREECPLGAVPFIQAQLLARFLRGDTDGYPPFFWK